MHAQNKPSTKATYLNTAVSTAHVTVLTIAILFIAVVVRVHKVSRPSTDSVIDLHTPPVNQLVLTRFGRECGAQLSYALCLHHIQLCVCGGEGGGGGGGGGLIKG